MRKIIMTAALAGTALALTACGETTEDAADTETVADTETAATDAADEDMTVLNANDANAVSLSSIEGIDAELAQAIMAGQPYESIVDFNNVLTSSLTDEQAAAIRERVFVPVNLNEMTREQIDLIPGMDERMAHEFEEYAPYDDMAEFDREIGKYVDEEEVARFRQYITL